MHVQVAEMNKSHLEYLYLYAPLSSPMPLEYDTIRHGCPKNWVSVGLDSIVRTWLFATLRLIALLGLF